MKKSEFIKEWNAIDKMKLFEFQVIDKRTNQIDYITFDVFISGRSFIAQHVALNRKQEKSKKIAHIKTVIDFDFTIDYNLQELFEDCQNAIIGSEFYTLND